MCSMSLGCRRRWIALSAVFLAVLTGLTVRLTTVAAPHLPTEIVVRAEGSMLPLAMSPSPRTLRVCADPNNLPFSNARGEGFENKIAELVARDLGRQIQYYWQPQRRGFIRTT